MKIRLTLPLLLLVPVSLAQTSGPTATKGSCSPAVSGNNNVFKIQCSGISKEQAGQFLTILNKIAQNQIPADKVMEKLDEIQKGIERDQRAWIGTGEPTITFADAVPTEAKVIIKNVGKTPATDITSRFDWTALPRNRPITANDLNYATMGDPIFSGDLFPTAMNTINKKTVDVLPVGTTAPYKSGDQIFYLYGTVSYKDVFGGRHRSHFCYILDRDLIHFTMCNIYNDTDDDK